MTDVSKLVRTRLKAKDPAEHPDANVLSAFLEQSLPDVERGPVLAHLARCSDCREVVALAHPAVEAQAVPATVAENQWRLPGLRWAAVVACFLVVGAAVLLRDRSPQVAMQTDADVTVPSAPAPATLPRLPASESDKLAQTKRQLEEEPNAAAKEKRLARETVASPHAENKPAETSRSNVAAAVASSPKTTLSETVTGGSVSHFDSLDSKEARRDESAGDLRAPAATPTQRAATTKGALVAHLSDVPEKAAGARPETVANEMQTAEVATSTAPVVGGNARSLDFPGRAKAAPAAAQTEPVNKDAGLKKQASTGFAKSELASGGAHWTLSDQGQLQRSLDNGSTWEAVPVLESVSFRALSAVGVHIWVGGAKGVLYHSADAGTHWTQVKPVSGGSQLSDDIVEMRFADVQHGELSTASGEVWITGDAGQSWRKNN